MLEILKKPIVIAVFLFIITYATLHFTEMNRRKKYPESDKKQVNIYIPGVVSILGYFISSHLRVRGKKTGNSNSNSNSKSKAPETPAVSENAKSDAIRDLSEGVRRQIGGDINSLSDHFTRKGEIRLRQPDIFIDLVDY